MYVLTLGQTFEYILRIENQYRIRVKRNTKTCCRERDLLNLLSTNKHWHVKTLSRSINET